MVTLTNLSIFNYPNNIAGDPTPIFGWSQSTSPTLLELEIIFGATNPLSADPNTTLLLQLDNNATDYSSHNFNVTNNNVTFSSSIYKFGGYSGFFNGSTASLSVPHDIAFNFGTNDFTIDFWINPSSLSGAVGLMSRPIDSNNDFEFFINSSGTLIFYHVVGGVNQGEFEVVNVKSQITVGTWNHIAVVRHGTGCNCYVNGIAQPIVSIFPFTNLTDINTVLNIGYGGGAYFEGYMDEIRVSNGLQRWTSNFTPPTSAYGLSINFWPPLFDIQFQSTNGQYLLSPEFRLTQEGLYYAQIRGYDGTWGPWSPLLAFNVSLFPPPPPIINPVNPLASNFTQTITGIKQSNLYVYISINNGSWVEASYPNGLTGTAWSYTITLSSGDNNIVAVTSFTHSTIGALSIEVNTDIYLATKTPEIYNVWNAFDELGLLLSLQRNPGEKNVGYKARLEDVGVNPGNSTYTGLINGISRELGVLHSQITVNRLSDLMNPKFSGNLLNSNGNAIGTPLIDYAEEVYRNNPVFLGTVISDQSYWDGVNQSTNGYSFLPHIWDANAAGIPSKWQGGGIGDHDDLWVAAPIQVWNASIDDYSWYLQIHTGYFYSANPWGLFGSPSGIQSVMPSGIYVEDDSGVIVLDDGTFRIKDDEAEIFF